MSDGKSKDNLYEFAQDTLNFARTRRNKGDRRGEAVALEHLSSLVNKMRKQVER